VAGRRPNIPRDAKDGATPLQGVPVGKKKSGKRDADYPAGWLIEERTARFIRDVLRSGDYPDYLRHPMYARALQAWARAEVITDVIYAWMDELMSVQGSIAAMMLPPMPGTKALIETWRIAERGADQARKALGLDPASYAKLMDDLGLTRKAEDAALGAHIAAGAEIVARRRALKAVPADG